MALARLRNGKEAIGLAVGPLEHRESKLRRGVAAVSIGWRRLGEVIGAFLGYKG